MQLVDSDGPGPRRDFVGYGRHVPKVVWPEGARVAVSLCLNYEGGSSETLSNIALEELAQW